VQRRLAFPHGGKIGYGIQHPENLDGIFLKGAFLPVFMISVANNLLTVTL
jgi:hypothetical protein